MKRRRALRILVVVAAAAVCLAVIGWYFAHRAAKSLAEIGSELTVPVKGALGQILLEGVPKDQVAEVLPGEGLGALLSNSKSRPNTEGILEAYQPAFRFSNSRGSFVLTSDANIRAGSSVDTVFRRWKPRG